jgi:hypothetical protein
MPRIYQQGVYGSIILVWMPCTVILYELSFGAREWGGQKFISTVDFLCGFQVRVKLLLQYTNHQFREVATLISLLSRSRLISMTSIRLLLCRLAFRLALVAAVKIISMACVHALLGALIIGCSDTNHFL